MDRCDIHDEFSKRMEDEHERFNKRITILEKLVPQIYNQNASIEKLAINMENTLRELKEQGERLKTLENRDGEKWREVVKVFISGIVGVLVTLLFKGI